MTFQKKVLAFGEVHGICNLLDFKIGVLNGWLAEGRKVAVCLERSFSEKKCLDEWVSTGRVGVKLLDRFSNLRLAGYLQNEFEFLSQLVSLVRRYPRNVELFCLDIAFHEPIDRESLEVLNQEDEDQFDFMREQFMIKRLSLHQVSLDASDSILWDAGNMHAS